MAGTIDSFSFGNKNVPSYANIFIVPGMQHSSSKASIVLNTAPFMATLFRCF